MSLLEQLLAVRGRLWWRSFEQRTERPEKVQRALLHRLVAENRETAFGRQNGFSRIATVADYQAAVPVGDYEAFRPWVTRIQQGERRVLTAEDPYMFTMTSGTTGQPKLIPVNRSTRRGTSRLSGLWIYRCLADHPGVLAGRALVLVSPSIEGHTPQGMPYGSASGYIFQHASWFLKRVYALPYPVFTIKDYETKYYTIMRFALAQRVSLIATPNPSTILRLVVLADQRKEQLLRDIHDGTLAGEFDIPLQLRRQLTRFLKPNPKRVRELEHIVNTSGFLQPRGYWPEQKLVGCWKGGSVGPTVERLRPWFSPGTAFRDLGYLASEAQVTLPIYDEEPAGILALDTNFYEFIPEAEMGTAYPKALTAGQLQVGESYYIVITTPNGLYRYDINDVVRVAGFYRNTPLVEFLRKGRDMVSLTGEKLHLGQLMEAVEEAQSVTGLEVNHYRATGNVEACCYDLKVELVRDPVTDDEMIRFGRAVDDRLSMLNIEYQQKRLSGRLGPLRVQVMVPGWYARRLQNKLARAVRDTQFKDSLLGMPDEEDSPSDVVKELLI